ncbi:MAG: metabolite traffic protein EboE [Planctomycetota bacterium]
MSNARLKNCHLSYSTNVHPAESLEQLSEMLRAHVAPISRAMCGDTIAAINLRIGKRQVDELLSHEPLPSVSTLSDEILKAPPSPACEQFLQLLNDLKLDVVSINAFPITDFHAPRVKEMVYSPPWTDGGRALYSLKIAKALTHFMARAGVERRQSSISVPSGVFKGLYGDGEEVREQCAHFLTECARELLRLERLTGYTAQLGLEPEPLTTGETTTEFIEYYKTILATARLKYPLQLGVTPAKAEEIARRFITVNLDLCHQSVEFEDPVDDLKQFKAAGIAVSGLHLSAALKLSEPMQNVEAFNDLKALNEPRYLHQVVARQRNGALTRFHDLPELWNTRRRQPFEIADCSELRCHFHTPLFAELHGALISTRDTVGPAARFALNEGLTDNFVVETYTWDTLSRLARQGHATANTVAGQADTVDVRAGIIKELQWASDELTIFSS